jgi:hypothetical protein
MKRLVRFVPRLAVLAALTAAVVAAGCARKLTSVDEALIAGVFPEGVRGSGEQTPSDLVVWADLGLAVVADASPDTVVATLYRSAAGAIVGLVFDYIGAGGYQLFRREPNGAFRAYEDFVRTPTRRWTDHDYYGTTNGTVVLPPAQLFEFSDAAPPPTAMPAYIGRAVVEGVSSAEHPLTNLGQTVAGEQVQPLITMSWNAVAGAAGYWLHIYHRRPDVRPGVETIQTGLPSPIATGKIRDFFIGFIPAPLTSYKLGEPVPPGGRVLVYRIINGLQEVLIRVSAVDADGRLLATTLTGTDSNFGLTGLVIDGADTPVRYPLNARMVQPQRPPPPEVPGN